MRYLLTLLMLSCVTPDPRPCPDVRCPPCPRETSCEMCLRVCGDAGVKRCETYGSMEKNCECKGY